MKTFTQKVDIRIPMRALSQAQLDNVPVHSFTRLLGNPFRTLVPASRVLHYLFHHA